MVRSLVVAALCLKASAETVQLVQTSEASDRLAKKPDVQVDSAAAKGVPIISVDASKKKQKIEGFGGAITDSVAHVFSGLNSTLQERVVDLLWGKDGQQYNLGRLTIGATDFSTSMYSFAEKHDDYEMKHFTLDHDDKSGFIDLVQKAQKTNPSMQWLSSPWSPPSWLKRNKDMRNSESPGVIQTEQAQKAYALYLSKYFTEMAKRNINVTRMTVQNEPHVKGQFAATYPCCGFDGSQERDFLRDYLGPQIRKDHPHLQIYVHDDQKSNGGKPMMMDYVTTIMNDTAASKYVDGVAFHWYGDNLKNYAELEKVHSLYPHIPLLATEATLEDPTQQHLATSPWIEAQKYAVDIIGDLNGWTTGWIEWNVLLDASGGPTCIGPSHTGICTPLIGHCDAPILADASTQTLKIRDTYWIMGHFSRFIPRGSTVLSSSVDSKLSLLSTSVLTPENKIVTVILNTDKDHAVDYQVQLGADRFVKMKIPAHGIQTLTAAAPETAVVV